MAWKSPAKKPSFSDGEVGLARACRADAEDDVVLVHALEVTLLPFAAGTNDVRSSWSHRALRLGLTIVIDRHPERLAKRAGHILGRDLVTGAHLAQAIFDDALNDLRVLGIAEQPHTAITRQHADAVQLANQPRIAVQWSE